MKFFLDLLFIFGAAALLGVAAHLLRFPHLVGFLLAGVIIGPAGLGLVRGSEQVNLWSEIGIVLLLLAIGLELSPSQVRSYRRVFLFGGALQLLFTVAITMALLSLLGLLAKRALLWGFVLSMSSTAVALSLLEGRREIDAPQGRISMAILLFQDLMVMPLLFLLPLLAGEYPLTFGDLAFYLLRLGTALGGIYFFASYALLPLLDFFASRKSRELFSLGVLAIILAISGALHLAGFSLGLGAFMAGFLLSRSPYRSQILSELEPFKDLLLCLFFVSVGLRVERRFFFPPFLLHMLPLILGIVLVKTTTTFFAVKAMGYPWRMALLVSLLLCQIGEFSLVLAQEGLRQGAFTLWDHQLTVMGAFLTIVFTPILYEIFYRKTLRYRLLPFGKKSQSPLEDHLVIVGYGLMGKHVATAALRARIPYVVVELNPVTVRRERRKGISILFGDATRDRILEKAGVPTAKVVVVTVPDIASAKRIVALCRQLNPWTYIVVRSRYAADKEVLISLGADEVVVEEIMAAGEVFRLLLVRFGLSPAFAEEMIEGCRGVNRTGDAPEVP